jgi:hypothetical protein
MANRKALQASVLALLLTMVPLSGAGAQSRPDPAQRPEPAPGDPAAVPPEKIAPPDARTNSGGSGGTGSARDDGLSRATGVIRPPIGIDPGMAAQPPDPGPHSMPVLPPPGSAGGNSAVVPK